MAYRNGIYVGFDGNGEKNPTTSGFKYYGLIKAWKLDGFIDSHEKTYSVRDTSNIATLKSRLRERMNNSKTFLIIINDNMRDSGSMLDYEIDIAEQLQLPLIIVYTGTDKVDIHKTFINKLPLKLRNKLQDNKFDALHIPFKQQRIEQAIVYMNIHNNYQKGSFLSY